MMNMQYLPERIEREIMNRSSKIMLAIAGILVLICILVLSHDHTEFVKNAARIAYNLESSDPYKMEAAWFTIVIFRCALFLVPAFILAFCSLYQIINDHLPHHPKR